MSAPTEDFVHLWEWFGLHCHDYSPLYERLSIAVAGDAEGLRAALAELISRGPASCR